MAAGKRKLTSDSGSRRGRGHTGGRRASGRPADGATSEDRTSSTPSSRSRAESASPDRTAKRRGARVAAPADDRADERAVERGSTRTDERAAAEPAAEPAARADVRESGTRRRPHGLDKPEVTQLEIGSTVHRVVPDPKPLDVDGIRTMTVGSVLWLAAMLGLLPFLGTLQRNGEVWWLWTCLAGFGLGLIGVEYCRRRKLALDAEEADEQADVEAEQSDRVG